MSPLSIEEFYAQSIGVTAPWQVVHVEINAELRQVRIRVECAAGTVWGDPDTCARAEIKDWQERTWRHLDTCEYETVVSARVPRLKMSDGSTLTVRVPWAEPGGRLTLRMEARLISLLEQCRTLKGAAQLSRVSADQMDGVMRRAVARGLARRAPAVLQHVGLDEKAFGKGQRYVTLLNDLDEGRVLEVTPGRTQEAAQALLLSLPEASRGGIQAVALDMWPAYEQAASAVLPQASQVYDRFHVSKHLNEAVDKVRRKEHRERSAEGDRILSKSKYLWLHSRLDLRTKTGIAFRRLLNEDLDTATAWGLKENFRRFWSHKSWARACAFLHRWVEAARDTALKPLAKVADLVDKHAEGLLNYIHHPISNAASEALNSAVQSLKHLARGLPNAASLRIRILFFLGKLSLCPA